MKRHANTGFTLIEALVVVAITIVMAAVSIPMAINAVDNYRLSSAVAAATGAISATRYQAIMRGYPYQLVFTAATRSYQVYNDPGATTCPTTTASYTAVGGALPLPSAGPVMMSGTNFTFTLCPNGTVTSVANPAGTTFELQWTNQSNIDKCGKITVSGVGNVSVVWGSPNSSITCP